MSTHLSVDQALLSSGPLVRVIENDAFATQFRLLNRKSTDRLLKRHPHVTSYVSGALYRSDGSLIDESRRAGVSGGDVVQSVDPTYHKCSKAEIVRYDGKSLYLGNYMNHYGHFITEFMSRLWSAGDGCYDRVVVRPFIFNQGKVIYHRFAEVLLSIIIPGLNGLEVLIDEAVFDHVTVPEQGWPVNSPCNVEVRKVYDKVRQRFTSGRVTGDGVFLSRRQAGYERITNIAECEDVARRVGLKVVHVEDLEIEDQLMLFANTSLIAGFEGTALHNCVFCRPGTVVIDLGDVRTKTRPHIMQSTAHAISGVDMYHIPYQGNEEGICSTSYIEAELGKILKL